MVSMTVDSSLFGAVTAALQALKPKYPRMAFHIEVVQHEIELARGNPLSAEEVAQIPSFMRRLWGAGIEPAAMGDQGWKFGPGRPPVSRETSSQR